MTECTATKSKSTAESSLAVRCSSVVSKLKSWTTAAIARHHQRVVSLRVHRVARQDGRAGVTGTALPARPKEPMTMAAREAGNFYSPQRRLLGWFAAVYAAHETRLIALRVYDHSRV